jgi:hypothetical protein
VNERKEEHQCHIVPQQPEADVAPPRIIGEKGVRHRPQPLTPDEDMGDARVLRELTKTLNECDTRHLVTVDAEDPASGTLRVQPTDRALQGPRDLDPEQAVGDGPDRTGPSVSAGTRWS